MGRLISNRWLARAGSESADSVAIEIRTYDGSGGLLIDRIGIGNAAPFEKVCFYDDQGRLLRIVDGSGDRTSFHYDEQGRKSEFRDLAHKSDDREARATGMDVMFADMEGNPDIMFAWIRNPSRIKTIYNERDQPTETQALDADGRLLSRILRAYDEKERITDIRMMIEDPTSQFSEKQMADLIAQAGVSRDEMRAQLKKAFDVLTGKMGKSYTDDSQGRRTKIVLHQASPGDVGKTYAFNDLGDVVEEQDPPDDKPAHTGRSCFRHGRSWKHCARKSASEWPPQPEFPSRSVHYTCQYDSYGNWIEPTVSCSDSPPYTRRREHTYY